ncbi:SRPBCC family protein [Cytobacillus purgationiresistens]|uniref:Ligand-binding SRPBCC domain-containing protein n=1 Tax=Cytobacillus purgationiresistens TaxID=863449 RepID=A0ABU0AKL1_9BACI|nr:SRPBCC family protein [Cytobacillus purgationiresistens]MDQ0271809.1 ligand-binding SRPBCC domain-containing protein [Cytobacillus purgationiresistens]
MADFRSSVMINKPLDEVFEYMLNVDNIHEIMPIVAKREQETEGQIGKGTRFLETRSIRGKNITSTIEVLAFEQNRTFTTKSDSSGLIVEYKYDFHEIEEGTQVELEANLQTTGLRMKLTKPLLVKMIKREDGNQLTNLKDMLEGNNPLASAESELEKTQVEEQRGQTEQHEKKE